MLNDNFFNIEFINMKASASILDKIPNVIIDTHGVFKYIQIFVRSSSTDETKYVVRGYTKYKYHADNYEDFVSNLKLFKSRGIEKI